MSDVPRNVSFYLLMQDKEAKAVIESGDEKKFKDILYKWGCDVYNQPYEVVSCEHRPVEGKPFVFNGPLVVSSERVDSEWLASGFASFNAKVASTGDIGLKLQLEQMSKQGSSEKAFTNKSAGRKAVKEEKSRQD